MSPIRTALFAAVATAAFAVAAPAQAQTTVTQISSDPFAPNSMPTAAHATEVEPDTFAFGSTVVAAFQTGRVFNGGSSDIGFATSLNGGGTWTHGFLPATTTASTPIGPFFATSDSSVAYDAKHGVWLISWLGLHFAGGGIVDVMTSRSTAGADLEQPGRRRGQRRVLRQELERLRQHADQPALRPLLHRVRQCQQPRPGADVHIHRRRADLGAALGDR